MLRLLDDEWLQPSTFGRCQEEAPSGLEPLYEALQASA
jgi:hypothetical protein